MRFWEAATDTDFGRLLQVGALIVRVLNVLHCFVCFGLLRSDQPHGHLGPCCCLTNMLRVRARQLSLLPESLLQPGCHPLAD